MFCFEIFNVKKEKDASKHAVVRLLVETAQLQPTVSAGSRDLPRSDSVCNRSVAGVRLSQAQTNHLVDRVS